MLVILTFSISMTHAETVEKELTTNSKQGEVYSIGDVKVSVEKCSLKKIDGLYRVFVQISFSSKSTRGILLEDTIQVSAYQGGIQLEKVNKDTKGVKITEKVSSGKNGTYINGFTLIDPKKTIKICLAPLLNEDNQSSERVYSLSLKNKKISMNEVDDPNNWLTDEEESKTSINENASSATNKSILFRNIKWYEHCSTVRKTVETEEGLRPSWYNPVDEGARIDSWYRQWKNMYTDVNITNGGVILNYDDVSVAGYIADLSLSFLYPIINNAVSYETDTARFYKAKYKIENLEDFENAFLDIKAKLSTLYGAPEAKSYYNTLEKIEDPKGCVWTAPDGSLVWLGLYYNSYAEKYDELHLVYSAPEVEKILLDLDAQIKKEISEQEKLKRQENTSNFDGL